MGIIFTGRRMEKNPSNADEYVVARLWQLESMIDSGEYVRSHTAEWIEDVDYIDTPDGNGIKIHTSRCSECGKQEHGQAREAGRYCRGCGATMKINDGTPTRGCEP